MDESQMSWGDYPIDNVLIRHETRTIHDVIRRIEKGSHVMDPDFQRDFIWDPAKQSKLIESVMMRIPLPVFYLAEDSKGRMIVVDGLQRLSTFQRFVQGELKLRLPDRSDLNGKRFADLEPKFQNRVEDCNLIFYIIDSKAPEQACLDIFERVNSGEPLSRQQMRQCLFMGPATQFLRRESQSENFLDATGGSLDAKSRRDREFVNRFCAFQLLGVDWYRDNMDDFLAECLSRMNGMGESDLSKLSDIFQRSMVNNYLVFGKHAFRKHTLNQEDRNVLNASLWDVMSTGLAGYAESRVKKLARDIQEAICSLLEDEEFGIAITYATNGKIRVRTRFKMAHEKLEEVLGVPTD